MARETSHNWWTRFLLPFAPPHGLAPVFLLSCFHSTRLLRLPNLFLEDHDLELRGKTYPIFSNLKVPQPIAKWYTAANIAPAATRNLVVGLVKRVEGVYLSVYNTLGSDGTAVVNVTCNGLSKGTTSNQATRPACSTLS